MGVFLKGSIWHDSASYTELKISGNTILLFFQTSYNFDFQKSLDSIDQNGKKTYLYQLVFKMVFKVCGTNTEEVGTLSLFFQVRLYKFPLYGIS